MTSTTGQLKNKVTPGDGVTTGVVRINDTTRTLWFTAVGREPGQNPYYTHYYRVKLDGTQLVSLTPDDGTHTRRILARRASTSSTPGARPTCRRPARCATRRPAR